MENSKNKKHGINFVSFAVLFLVVLIIVAVKIVFPLKYKNEIERYAREYCVPTSLVFAVVWTESGFDADALSGKGAVGLMQIMPSTARWCAEKIGVEYEDEMLLLPSYNIKIGTYYLSYLSQKFEKTDDILSAYNAGEGKVRKWLEQNIPVPYRETREYIKKVKFALKVYKFLLKD